MTTSRINTYTNKLERGTSDCHVGPTAPAMPYAGKLWLDTTLSYADQTVVVSVFPYSVGDTETHLVCSGTGNVFLKASALADGILKVSNVGTGIVTLWPNGSETINGKASISLDFQWTTVDLAPITGGYVI